METAREISISLNFNRRQLLFALAVFFVAWHPGFIGSESLTLTTYYPAPYGGYVSLLTTGQTLLARDGGNVGIRTGADAPRRPLDVNGDIVTTTRMTFAQNMDSTSQTWNIDNSAGRFRVFQQPNINTAGTEAMTILGNGRVGINTTNPVTSLHVGGSVMIGSVPGDNGDLYMSNTGTMFNFCSRVWYSLGVITTCPIDPDGVLRKQVVGFVPGGPGVISGFLPASATTADSAGNIVGNYVTIGSDYEGWMICCRVGY